MTIRELIKMKRPFTINGINFSFSTFTQLWVSTKDSDVHKLDAWVKGDTMYNRAVHKKECHVAKLKQGYFR